MALRTKFSGGRGVSAIAIAAAALALPAVAAAQDAAAPGAAVDQPAGDTNASDEIVVTGFNQSLAKALSVKRNSDLIVDSISAEDVGKLPDISIADALSRLPGVAVQTQQGRGEVISIRGFSGDFTGALLNGREIATIDDNRRFDYGQMPGDLFNRVDVMKTASADLIGSGLAGTVNLQSIDPLANKRILSVNVQGELDGYHKLNPDQTNKGYKAGLIYSDSFAGDTLGISLGFSAIQSPVQNKQYAAWGYPTDGSGNYTLGGGKWFADTNVLYRQTGFGHLVYRPNDKVEASLDALYSNYKYREYQRGAEVPLWWSSANETGFTAANGWQQTATYDNVYAVQRNNYNTRDAHTLALGGNLKIALSDKTRLVIDASYSRAHRHDNAYETYTGTGYAKSGAPDSVSLALQPNGTYAITPTLDYTDTSLFKLTDPQGWGYYDDGNPSTTNSVVQAGYVNEPDFTDTIKALRASLQGEFDGGLIKGWEFGVNFADRTKINHFTGYYLVPPVGTTEVDVPQSAIVGSVNPFNFNGSTLAYSVPGVLSALSGSFRNVQPSESTKQWYVDEKSLTAYMQANVDGTLAGLETRGNFGVQMVYTDQHSIGNAASSTSLIVPTDLGARYIYVLPSANLNFRLADDLVVRLAASRTMSRSRLLDENSSFTVSFIPPNQQGNPVLINGKNVVLFGTGGNPTLRPYFSNNADLSIEKYFAGGEGIVAVSGFFKGIENFVEPFKTYQTDLSAFSGLIDTSQVAPGSYTLVGYVGSPANTGHGHVGGVEVQATVPFKAFSSALDGFGVRGSASWTQSKISYSTGAPVTLPGLSKWVVNGQAYFEKWGFNARVSYQYRSDFLGEYLAFGQQLSLIATRHRSTVDAQVGYDFKSGPLNGLSIYLQGHNLTNSPFIAYTNNDPKQIVNYETYGPTYLAGLTMKF